MTFQTRGPTLDASNRHSRGDCIGAVLDRPVRDRRYTGTLGEGWFAYNLARNLADRQ